MAENIREEYTEDYSAAASSVSTDRRSPAGDRDRRRYRCRLATRSPATGTAAQSLPARASTLDEAEAKQRLADFTVPVPAGARVASIEAAQQLANKLGYPVVLKALGIAHKTEHNAVRLNLQSDRKSRRLHRAFRTQR